MRTKRMTVFLTLTLTIIFSFVSYPFTWAGDSERTASVLKSDSFHKDLSPNISDKISQMPSSMEHHERGLSSVPAGALDSAPNIWSRVERAGVSGFFNHETADFKREALREGLPRSGPFGLPLRGTNEKSDRVSGVANLLNPSGNQPSSNDPTFGRSPARSSKESVREMMDSLIPPSTDPLSGGQGGIRRGGGTDSSDLFDIMKQGRQEEKDRMRSTDPRAHMPEEAQDRPSSKADRIGQAASGMSPEEERQLREETLPWIRGESNEVPSDDNQVDDPEDPDDDEKAESSTDTTPLPDDAGPLPSWAAPTARFLEGLEPTNKINRADKNPWINPDPERSSVQGDLGVRRMDPITPVVNPNPDDQGSGGGGEGDRVVRGPGYGQIDPSPEDEDEDDQPTPGNSGNS